MNYAELSGIFNSFAAHLHFAVGDSNDIVHVKIGPN